LWNGSRFVLGIFEEKGITTIPTIDYKNLSSADEWILNKLNIVIKASDESLINYKIGEAGQMLYDFFWSDFCDWYLELSKGEKQNPAVLYHVLKNSLILLHPFMPFVTEEIWGYLPGQNTMLIIEKYSESDEKEYHSEFTERAIDAISSLRTLRAENKIEPAKKISAVIYAHQHIDAIRHHQEDIVRLARLETLTIQESGEKISNATSSVINDIEVFVLLEGLIDREKEKARLQKEIENLEKYAQGIQNKLSNENFVANAPKAVVDGERVKMEEAKGKAEKMREQMESL